jgi:hypothetical protein
VVPALEFVDVAGDEASLVWIDVDDNQVPVEPLNAIDLQSSN